MLRKKKTIIIFYLIVIVILIVIILLDNNHSKPEQTNNPKNPININLKQKFAKDKRYNSFWIKFIDSLAYKNTIIEYAIPQITPVSCSNYVSHDFNEWLNIPSDPEYGYEKNVNKKSNNYGLPFLYIRIGGIGGGDTFTNNGITYTPFIRHLFNNKIFNNFQIMYWTPVYFSYKEKYNIETPYFDVLCFEAEDKNSYSSFDTFLMKAKNNIKTKHFSQNLFPVLTNKITQIAEKSKPIKLNKIKLYDQTANIELLVELTGGHICIKNFISNLSKSDNLLVIKLAGLRNTMFESGLPETINKSNFMNKQNNLKCVLLIQFPIYKVED